eukprot:TRINITY_DN13079_c0_g1_i4.p1 TRINITY_DN13079_c0_g1~~TRINITY_DN13079_c0_g1_i4.p1  ORF type:complete len:373 (-),score=63.59 TRINITY_DN13079_c0_g1_i4:21-1139(-)
MLCCGLYLGKRLTKYKDDRWKIRKELTRLLVLAAAMILLWQIWIFVLKSQADQTITVLCYSLLWIGYVLIHMLSITLPMIEAQMVTKRMEIESGAGRPSRPRPTRVRVRLADFLEQSQCYDAFYRFLQGEFALENLAFWKSVQKYRELGKVYLTQQTKDSANDVFIMAEFIFQNYIITAGPSCVNLSHKTRLQVEQSFKSMCMQFGRTASESRSQRGTMSVIRSWGRSIISSKQATPKVRSAQNSVFSNGGKEMYTRPDSPRPGRGDDEEDEKINVHDVGGETVIQISDESLAIFDGAAEQVLHMMEKDSFSRFTRTPEYKEAKQFFEAAQDHGEDDFIADPDNGPTTPTGTIKGRETRTSSDLVVNVLPKW